MSDFHVRRGARFTWASLLFFSLCTSPVAAGLSGYGGGGVTRGSDGYKETSAEAGFSLHTQKGRGLRFFAEGSSYGVEGSTETSRTWILGGTLDVSGELSLAASFWGVPPPEVLSEGSYRAKGMDAGLILRWDGFLPTQDISSWRGSMTPSVTTARHEEYFLEPIPLRPERPLRQWVPINQRSAGLSLSENWRGIFWIAGHGRAYGYDRDLEEFSADLEIFSRASRGAASTHDLILGFPDNVWGGRTGVSLGRWADLELSWRRTTYVIGDSPRRDQEAASLSLHPSRFLTMRGRYEVSRPKNLEPDVYWGTGLELGF